MGNPFSDILSALSRAKVEYVLCGGVACVLQGCDRTTQDLDIHLAMDRENLEKALTVFRNLDFRPRIPEPMEAFLDPQRRESWRSEKNALVFTLVSGDGLYQVDLFLAYPVPWDELRAGADEVFISGESVLVSSRKDLIRAKEAVHPIREKDLWDIRVLNELNAGGRS